MLHHDLDIAHQEHLWSKETRDPEIHLHHGHLYAEDNRPQPLRQELLAVYGPDGKAAGTIIEERLLILQESYEQTISLEVFQDIKQTKQCFPKGCGWLATRSRCTTTGQPLHALCQPSDRASNSIGSKKDLPAPQLQRSHDEILLASPRGRNLWCNL